MWEANLLSGKHGGKKNHQKVELQIKKGTRDVVSQAKNRRMPKEAERKVKHPKPKSEGTMDHTARGPPGGKNAREVGPKVEVEGRYINNGKTATERKNPNQEKLPRV